MDDIPMTLPQFDIMIMPSNHEGFPLALLEAMAAGMPCVASRLKDTTDKAITAGVEGELCEKNDISDFAEKLYKYATDAKLREQVGKAARAKVERCFSIDSQGIAYNYVFASIMTAKNYKMLKAPTLENYKQPEMVKPHILARVLPLWVKKILKKFL